MRIFQRRNIPALLAGVAGIGLFYGALTHDPSALIGRASSDNTSVQTAVAAPAPPSSSVASPLSVADKEASLRTEVEKLREQVALLRAVRADAEDKLRRAQTSPRPPVIPPPTALPLPQRLETVAASMPPPLTGSSAAEPRAADRVATPSDPNSLAGRKTRFVWLRGS